MTDSALQEVFLGRQPIVDRQMATIGYELLFRNGSDNTAIIEDDRSATADVVCKAFAELGLASALGGQRAFINVAPDFLFQDAVELLPKGMVVLDVATGGEAPPDILDRCRKLKEIGYEFCVSWSAHMQEQWRPMLRTASYVRIDVNGISSAELAGLVSGLPVDALHLVAGKVESEAQMQLCKTQGFHYFQGYYFAKPTVVEGRKLTASTHNLIRLIDLLNKEADIAAIEAVFKEDPALSINLLRLTNSVGVGLTVKVNSVRHAITAIGRRQLSRWLQLLLFCRPGQNARVSNNPLMQWAALRGYFMELLAGRCNPARKDFRDQAFLVGLMSLMPVALGLPMTDILGQIAVSADVRLALSRREGELGALLELTERYDNNDVAGTCALFPALGGKLTLQSLSLCLAESIAWVQQLGTEGD